MVSIIFPIYNQEKYLDNSIQAAINQEYRNIEIVLVNDGSTDGSKQIIEKYQKSDDRIVVVEKANGGLVDATIAGIKVARGEFICFFDPDDTIGEDFVANFINLIGDCDVIACGFYRNNAGRINPVFLEKDCILEGRELDQCREELLIKRDGLRNSHRIYISRWNKMYRSEIVMKFLDAFSKCVSVSLGEDSIFTYLLLANCKKIRAVQMANSYYYNIGNQSSMMKSGAIYDYVNKAHIAFDKMKEFEEQYGDNDRQAYALFFFLIESLFHRIIQNQHEFQKLFQLLRKDKLYNNALTVCQKINGRFSKMDFILRKIAFSSDFYRRIFETYSRTKQIARHLKWYTHEIPILLRNIKENGPIIAFRMEHFRSDRFHAFKDLKRCLPKLESRINPIIAEYIGLKTDLSECPIENNVFVFWWDGFDKSPALVQRCFDSVLEAYKDCNIIKISKNNYLDYTDIHPTILRDYNAGKISVQTFSDILRFNLLKNNGGIWIDATIYFEKPYNLLNGLSNKSVESVAFSTSANFLQYKGEVCSWSGYFFASRKNSILVQAMDTIFREYYLKYHTYSIYFFIDAALMICKINHIDNDALGSIQKNNADMMLLAKLLNATYTPVYRKHIAKIPQKLSWNYKDNGRKDSVYSVILNDNGDE